MAVNDNPFRQLTNLADSRLGASAVFTTDDWFGPGERLLAPHDPVFHPGRFDERGQWMDGWETRRRRTSGNDYAIIRLGYPGTLAGVDIDTSHFTGNYPPAASIEACYCPDSDPNKNTSWVSLMHSIDLGADSHHFLPIADKGLYSHIRLNIYPDGGVARLRVYGTPNCDWQALRHEENIDLLALRYGGRAITCNDEHYGSIRNLNLPGRGVNMGDGWETRRRREPGNDWAILALGHAGVVNSIEVDTAFFRGNYPDACSIQAAFVLGGTESSLVTQSMFWDELLPVQKLQADYNHRFENDVRKRIGPITHIRLNIIPDGGISRLRVFGNIAL